MWSYLISSGGINPAPVVDRDYVYASHGDENLEGGERGMLVCLDGSKVKFTNENSGKSVETNATVESNGKSKFDSTALETEQNNGVNTIHEIDLGGTPTKIKFQ